MKDYRSLKMSMSDVIKYYVISSLSLAFLGLLFYRSIAAVLVFALGSIPLKRLAEERYRRAALERLSAGFRDMLYMISSSVSAGRQLPQAVEEASRQLASSWGSESDIACEASEMAYRYGRMNEDIDLLWDSLAKRSGLEEISQFASSCRICRRSGGDLEDVCMKCSAVLLEKIAFGDELKALTAQRKLDIAVLTAMPVAMLIMLNILSYSYIEVLYTTAAGRIIMTAAAGLMAAALLWSLKISEVSI